jgi:group I intron endonuclease
MKSGIYTIKSLHNEMVYVGSSSNVHKRWAEHRSYLKADKHPNRYLQNTYNKHGYGCFEWEVVESCKVQELLERETYWISTLDSYKNGYNLIETPIQGNRGFKHTEETKKIMSEKKKGLRPSVAKFSDEEVKEIRQKYLDGQRTGNLADTHNVSRSTIRKMLQMETYSDVPASKEYLEMLLKEKSQRKEGTWNRRKGWKQDPEFVERLRKINSSRPSKNRRLTDEQVREIRRRKEAGETGRVLAEEFGVNQGSIGRIAKRLIYKEVD